MPNDFSRADIRSGEALKRERFAAGVNALQPNSYLTDLSVGFQQDMFIADMVAPRIQVTEEKGEFPIWGREHYQSETNTGDTTANILRPLRGQSVGISPSPTTGAYQCEEYAVHWLLDDREKGKWADAEEAYTLNVNQLVSLEREVRVAAFIGSGTNLSENTTLSGTSQWSDYTNSDPLGDLETGIHSVVKTSGQKPNTAFMNPDVYIKLRRHPQVRAMFNVQQGAVSDEQLAAIIGVPTINVGWAIYDNSNEGATYSGAYVWPKYLGLMYVPPSPGLLVPASAYQVFTQDRTVRQDRVERQHSDWYELSEIQDIIVPTPNAAYLIIDAVA